MTCLSIVVLIVTRLENSTYSKRVICLLPEHRNSSSFNRRFSTFLSANRNELNIFRFRFYFTATEASFFYTIYKLGFFLLQRESLFINNIHIYTHTHIILTRNEMNV